MKRLLLLFYLLLPALLKAGGNPFPAPAFRPAMVNGSFRPMMVVPAGQPTGIDQVSVAAFNAANNALNVVAGGFGVAPSTPNNANQVFTSIFNAANNAIQVVCLSGCGGGGGSSAFQVNGTLTSSQTTINFINGSATAGLTPTFSNPSAGNIALTLAGTVNQVNGASLPASATVLATNSSNQIIAAPLTSGSIFIGNVSNIAVAQAVTGDASLVANGTVTNTGMNGAAVPASATVIGTNSSKQLVASTGAAGTVLGNATGSTAAPTYTFNPVLGTTANASAASLTMYGSTASSNLAPASIEMCPQSGTSCAWLYGSTSFAGQFGISSSAPTTDVPAGKALFSPGGVSLVYTTSSPSTSGLAECPLATASLTVEDCTANAQNFVGVTENTGNGNTRVKSLGIVTVNFPSSVTAPGDYVCTGAVSAGVYNLVENGTTKCSAQQEVGIVMDFNSSPVTSAQIQLTSSGGASGGSTPGSPATSLQFNSSGTLGGISNFLYTAASGKLSMNQFANTNETLYGVRATDTSPSGNFFHFQNNAANADLSILDVNGNWTSTSYTATGLGAGFSSYGCGTAQVPGTSPVPGSGYIGFTSPTTCSSGFGLYILPALPASAGILHAATASGNTSVLSTGLVSLTADVSGILPIANGGIGSVSLAASQCLQTNGAGTAYILASCAGSSGTPLNLVSGATAQATSNESAAGDNYTYNGVETSNLTAPVVFQNTNATNTTSSAVIFNAAGAGNAANAAIFNCVTSSNKCVTFYSGATVTNGTLSGGSAVASLSTGGTFSAGSYTAGSQYASNGTATSATFNGSSDTTASAGTISTGYFRGGQITSGTQSGASGAIVVGNNDNGESGSNAVAGSSLFTAGGLINATPGSSAQVGLRRGADVFLTGTTAPTNGEIACFTGNFKVGPCASAAASASGHGITLYAENNGTTIYPSTYVQMEGTAGVVLDGTVTTVLNDNICVSTTTIGEGHDNSTLQCSAYNSIGTVEAVVTTGTTFTMSGASASTTTLPIIATFSSTTGLVEGCILTISGVTGITGANGNWTASHITGTTAWLDGATGSGTFGGSPTVTLTGVPVALKW